MSTPESKDSNHTKNDHGRRKKVLLGALIGIGLLSLLVFLVNPGLLIPPNGDHNKPKKAEAIPNDNDNSTGQSNENIPIAVNKNTGVVNHKNNGTIQENAPVLTPNESPGEQTSDKHNLSTTVIFNGGISRGGGGSGGVSGSSQSFNHAPLALDGSAVTNENVTKTLQLNATDADGDSLTFSIVSLPSHGSLGDLSGNAVTYTPSPNYHGPDSFTFKSSDSRLFSNAATVSITVMSINAPPTANAGMDDSVYERAPYQLNGTGSFDPDGDTLTYSWTQTDDHNAPQIALDNNTSSRPSFTAPAVSIDTILKFKLTVSDGNGHSADDEVIITVSDLQPDAPLITSPSNGTITNNNTTLFVSGTSEANSIIDIYIDGNLMPVSPTTNTTAGSDGNWSTVINTTLADGSHNVTARATDAQGLSSAFSSPAQIIVDTRNPDSPVIYPLGSPSNSVNQIVSGTAEAGSTIEIFVDGNETSIGTTTADNGQFSIPINLSEGAHSITATATDAAGNTSEKSQAIIIVIDLTPPDAPAITSPAAGGLYNLAEQTVSGTAEPGSTVTVFADYSETSIGTPAADNNGDWSLGPISFSDGDHTLNATATDAAGNQSPPSAAVTFSVDTRAPGAPVLNALDSPSNNHDQTITGTAEPGSTVTVFVDQQGSGTITADGDGQFSMPVNLSEGAHSITATATDVAGNTSPDSSVINIYINHPPVANDDSFPVDKVSSNVLDVLANDHDLDEGDSITIESITQQPLFGEALIDDGGKTITYTPNGGFNGQDSFEYMIRDLIGATDTATVTVVDNGLNHAPVAYDVDGVNTDEDASVTFTLHATDIDGNLLTFRIVNPPAHGSYLLDAQSGEVTYTPDPDYNGPDSLKFQAKDDGVDGGLDSNVASVTINVIPMNDPPVAHSQSVTTNKNVAKDLTLTATDVDGDLLTFNIVSGPSHGTISGDSSSATRTYTPAHNYYGSDSFTFVAKDGAEYSNEATVTITINNVNFAPEAVDDYARTTLDYPVWIPVLTNDHDPDGDNLTVTQVIISSDLGTVDINPDGSLVYTPSHEFAGEGNFSYVISDGKLTATATVHVTVMDMRFNGIKPPLNNPDHQFEAGNTAVVAFSMTDVSGNSVTGLKAILMLQKIDDNTGALTGEEMPATSAGNSNTLNQFDYIGSGKYYSYNLKTDDLALGKWALRVFVVDDFTDPSYRMLLEQPPFDGISTTIIIK